METLLQSFEKYGLPGLIIAVLFFILWKVISPLITAQIEYYKKVAESQERLASGVINLTQELTNQHEDYKNGQQEIIKALGSQSDKVEQLLDINKSTLAEIKAQRSDHQKK